MQFFVRHIAQYRPDIPTRRAPMLQVTLCLMTGIGCGWIGREYISSLIWLWAALGCGLSAILSTLFLRKKRFHRITLYLLLCALSCGGSTLLMLNYERQQTVFPEHSALWSGEVEKIGRIHKDGIHADLLLSAPGQTYDGLRIRAYIANQRHVSLCPGDRLTFKSQITTPEYAGNPHDFDYAAYLCTHGIAGTTYLNHTAWIRTDNALEGSWRSRLLKLRRKLTDSYASCLDTKNYALISALTLGDKSLLENDTKELFADTGTSHILALSGLHLGILYTLLHLLFLQWFRRKWSFFTAHLLGLSALWFFVFLAGAPLSLQRAACMLTLWIVCIGLRHTHSTGLNNWAVAASVILCCSPLSLLDVGFQLSFTAVLSILLCNDYLWHSQSLSNSCDDWTPDFKQSKEQRQGRQHRKWWVSFIQVSLSAQFGTLPLILYYFHQFTPYTLLANFLIIPSAYLLIGSALVFFLIPVPAIQSAASLCMNFVAQTMMNGLERMSNWPGATVRLYPSVLTLCALSLLPFLFYALITTPKVRRRVRLLYSIGGCLAVALLSILWNRDRRELNPQICIYNLPHTTMIHFIASNEVSYLYAPNAADTARLNRSSVKRLFWEPYHITDPQMVTAGHWESAHLLHRDNLFVFGPETLLLLHGALPPDKGLPPLHIHTLMIMKNCDENLAQIQKTLQADCIVLDRALPARLRRRWKTECRQAGIPCHDIREDGAFVREVQRRS